MLLHVTNGDSTARTIEQSGIGSAVLPWRDMLHEGPVPAGLAPSELAAERAAFLAASGYGDETAIRDDFNRRDRILADISNDAEVVLWFEHDLYDQLQLIQILDRFRALDLDRLALSLIALDRHPGIEPFHGLGQLDTRQIAALFPARRPVTLAKLATAADAWTAFRSSDPTDLARLAASGVPELPFLGPALTRFLADYPSTHNGLGRTEQQALHAIAAGHATPVAAFLACQAMEEAPFLGDTTFWHRLAALSNDPHPLLLRADGSPFAPPIDAATRAAPMTLTDDARAVLSACADAVTLRGIDRWYGGVHLTGTITPWRWNGQTLVPMN